MELAEVTVTINIEKMTASPSLISRVIMLLLSQNLTKGKNKSEQRSGEGDGGANGQWVDDGSLRRQTNRCRAREKVCFRVQKDDEK